MKPQRHLGRQRDVLPPEFTDERLMCVDCNSAFDWTAGEQAYFAEQGFTNVPKRCKPCRNARRGQQGTEGLARPAPEQREWQKEFEVVCDKCGADATVPFKPRRGQPVYCKPCFREQ